MKSFFNNLSTRLPFLANRPSALERAVRPSPKSRRLKMEPLENRELLAVDAFGVSASLADSDVGATWGPDPEPAAFSASVLATDAAIIDVSGVGATLAAASFSVQTEMPEAVAPPSFEQLMKSLGMIKIESLDDESDIASLSFLDATDASQEAGTQDIDDVSSAEARHVVFYDSSDADFDASTLNLDDESVYYVDAANANNGDAESYSVTPRSGGGNSGGSGGSGGSSNSGGSGVSGGGDNSAPFLSGGAGKDGYVDLVFSADDVNVANKVFTATVSSWFICSGDAPTYRINASQDLTCVTVDFNAETSRLSVAPTGNVGKGSFTVTAENDAGSCAVTVNVYSGRVVGYELEERVWGGDWSGVEDSGTDASGVGWNLLWRENEYRWKPIFENGIEPDVVQVRNVVVSAKPANATSSSPFAMESYAYQCSSGGGTATTPAPTPESWPFAVGEPSVNGENEIAMSVTLCGVNLNNDTRHCIAASNNVTLTQQNTEETAADRPRVAITEVQRVIWEEVTNSAYSTQLQDDPQGDGDNDPSNNPKIFFPEQVSPTSNIIANQIKASVTLAAPIPTGMEGTVSLNWFDPANSIGSRTAIPVIDGKTKQTAGKRDNNGSAELSTTELTFNQSLGTLKQSAALTVIQANAGDNYVVAAHPNASGVDRYWITENSEEGLEQLDASEVTRWNNENNASVAASVALEGRLQTPKLTVWRTLWVERDYMICDGKLPASIPPINGFVATEFARACVKIEDYANNSTPQVEGIEYLPVNGYWDKVFSVDDPAHYATPYRNIAEPSNFFWSIHLIGAYNIANEIAYGVMYEGFNTIFIFNDMLSSNAEKRQVTLHELGHAFDLDDTEDDTIMCDNSECLGGNNLAFSLNQLRTIQAQGKPL